MKRVIFLLMALSLLFSSISFGEEAVIGGGITTEVTDVDYDYKVPLEDAIAAANDEIEIITKTPGFYDISLVNREMYDKYGVIVYGEPHGDTKGEESRYVGYTPDGEPFANPVFERDSWTGGTFDERNWIEEPWWDDALKDKFDISPSDFNGTEDFTDNMKAGLLKYYPEDTDLSRDDWHKYMQILQPPTEHAPGFARMWHKNAYGTWYTTMILPSHRETITILIEVDPPPDPEPGIDYNPTLIFENIVAPQLLVKWDTVPIGVNKTSSITGKILRDDKRTWNQYRYIVEQWYPDDKSGKRVSSVNRKTVSFANDMFLKGKAESSNEWYTDSPSASYLVPSNTKPGTVLIVKLQLDKRVAVSDDKVPEPKFISKPAPVVPHPGPKPSRPSHPGDDASASEKSSYRADLREYRAELAEWKIRKAAYDEYIAKRDADWERLKGVWSRYNAAVDSQPSKESASSYNFNSYRSQHENFNKFIDSHTRRYISIEGLPIKLYWFTNKFVTGETTGRNVVIHTAPDLGPGGIDPGIIIPD